SRYARSSRLAIRAPRSGTYATNHCYGTLAHLRATKTRKNSVSRPPWQPVVKVWRRTETGEAPRGQGATTENTGCIRGRSNAAPGDASPVECSQTFTTGC